MARDGLGRIEALEGLTHDLVGAIALDALGAEVPGRDAPLRVQQEDRVVADALDEQPVVLLALAATRATTRGGRDEASFVGIAYVIARSRQPSRPRHTATGQAAT
jgi:hypothetical protein